MTAMNQNQLRAIFHYLKVPASAYDLGNNMRLNAAASVLLRYSPMKPMPVSICSIA